MMFPHTKDPKWIEKRKDAWVRKCNIECFDQYSKSQIESLKNYFFGGECEAYFNDRDGTVGYYGLLRESPIETMDQLILVTEKYLSFAFHGSHKWFKYIPEGPKVLPEGLGTALLSLSLSDCYYHPPGLLSELFFYLMGDKYDPERRLYVDFSEKYGDTEFSIEINEILKKMFVGMRFYLFVEDYSEHFQHYKNFVDYYVSLLPYDTELEKYSLQLVDPLDVDPTITDRIAKRKATKELKRARSRQESIRKFFMDVYGYGTDALDQDALNQLREGVEAVKMPDEFYPFIDFIHRHKEKSIEVSE